MRILDLGTGTGLLAIEAMKRHAERVVALDWNPSAVINARINAQINGFADRIDVRQSDMFENVAGHERFDLICANLPIMNVEAADVVESSIWDTHLHANQELVKHAREHLTGTGRILLAQADFGDADEVLSLIDQNGYKALERARVARANGDTFFAYELF